MRLIRGIHNIQLANQESEQGSVLTIGNFDGVHLGHQRVIKALVEKAKTLNAVPVVMVFEPQPQELFSPENAPARLTRLRDKYALLKKHGVKRLLCVNFNAKFANISAESFIEHLLVEQLNINHLIIGDDFRFGKGRTGDFKMLCKAGKQFGFGVSDTASFKLEDCRISSTAIREALQQDALSEAEKMLGREYSIIGRVFHGDKRGRTLGFPTANVHLKRRVSPVSGVYAVKVRINGSEFTGVANIGSRPSVNGIRQQLEVHIFDFEQDIYGQSIEVVLMKSLRKEQRFSSLAQLKDQIQIDSEQARSFFGAT
ncbi:bifunctional riboflavin kinase/FAD synthetase [Thalassotalea sp. 1_MG-2023]|uniref:bifunctional riboflavin kinase/FAD synthetase n=1 Tax=Thalassotalea sp. 1_MG-2023 TaxID=3062680 RepID=UPI0026E3ACD2|nr:bifunctional riboflavin kinase/FAD synthetase [Thalassotalea sp. 1_MG-2023]MDO6427828.1 bifunctional riboflavin kinase/FAD synthetase [Thalassotalea sp. 1_MG-2023]